MIITIGASYPNTARESSNYTSDPVRGYSGRPHIDYPLQDHPRSSDIGAPDSWTRASHLFLCRQNNVQYIGTEECPALKATPGERGGMGLFPHAIQVAFHI